MEGSTGFWETTLPGGVTGRVFVFISQDEYREARFRLRPGSVLLSAMQVCRAGASVPDSVLPGCIAGFWQSEDMVFRVK